MKMKYLGYFNSGSGFPDEYQGDLFQEIPFLKVGDTNTKGNERYLDYYQHSIDMETRKTLRAFIFPENATVFAKVGAALLLNKRRLIRKPSCLDNNMAGFIPTNCNPLWAYWILNDIDFCIYVNPGAVPSLNESILKELMVPVPSLPLQKAIAAYLDKETARIDALIAKKERQIELLEEKRQAIITSAITKGLNPKAKMKDSGVEWIGEIPQSWVVKRLSFCATFISGATPDKGNDSYWNGEIPWVSPKDMKKRYIDDSIDHLTAEAIAESGLRYAKSNMILVVVRGMILAHSFPVAITTRDVTINQDIKALKFDRQFETEYAAYLLMAFEKIIVSQYTDESAHGTKAIRMDNWKDFPVICPSLQEQKEIIDFLSHTTIQIDTTIGKLKKSCELLREYRSSLITSAVSGQTNVSQEVVK